MQEKSPIKRRILQYLEIKGITKYAFYRDSGVSRNTLDQPTGISEENLARFLQYAQDISLVWVLMGEGDIFNSEITENATLADGGAKGGAKGRRPKLHQTPPFPADGGDARVVVEHTFPLLTDRCLEMQRVPMYELNATAGLVELFTNDFPHVPLCHVVLPNLPPCDGALSVRGDSMYPLLKSGDIVLYKEVRDIENGIFWGEMYLVSLVTDDEEYITIKYVQRAEKEGFVRLVSHNPHHSPKEIPLSGIRALALIKASVRYNTMG